MKNKPLDYMGNELNVGDTVLYVGAGYTKFVRDVVVKVSLKTVTLGKMTPWGSVIRRPFTSVLVVKQGGTGSMQPNRTVGSRLSDAVEKLTMAGPYMMRDGFFNGPELHGERKVSGKEAQENEFD